MFIRGPFFLLSLDFPCLNQFRQIQTVEGKDDGTNGKNGTNGAPDEVAPFVP